MSMVSMMRRAIVLFFALGLAACSKPAPSETKKAPAAQPKSEAPAPPKPEPKRAGPRLTVEVYEAREVTASTAEVCHKFKGRCFALLTEAPAMTIDNFTFDIEKDRTLTISLSAVEAAQMARITRGMARPTGEARRLALLFEGKILHVPKVRAELKADEIRVSFCDKTILENFRRLKK